tara:strand:- start:817 stop:969 length:153 start_codon:yes stop_codon:yes gene_type:complete
MNAGRNRDFTAYTTRGLEHILREGQNRAYEHYFYVGAEREYKKRLRKRRK